MKNSVYDFAIVGSGPIGAATAYFLSQKTRKSIVVITEDPTKEHSSTYLYAGGSVRRRWKDTQRHALGSVTADFILQLADEGIDLSLIRDQYVFLTTGETVPSLSLRGASLVSYFLTEALRRGVVLKEKTTLRSFQKKSKNWVLHTSRGPFEARNVLIAVGQATKKFFPRSRITLEKRVLLVLDFPVSDSEESFPHLIIPFDKGIVYLFIKKVGKKFKMILGEEELIAHSSKWEGKDYLPELKRRGLLRILPFLQDVKTENVLWGFDVTHKTPRIVEEKPRLWSVTCGSAIRSCVGIGEMTVRVLLGK